MYKHIFWSDYTRNLIRMLTYSDDCMKEAISISLISEDIFEAGFDKEAFVKGENMACPHCGDKRIEIISVTDQVAECKRCHERDVFQSFFPLEVNELFAGGGVDITTPR